MEGAILDVREQAREIGKDNCPSGLWLRTDEDIDIVLLFPARQGGFGPKTFVRYGERVGRGQRFAYLRLAPQAEIFLPEATEGRVTTGDYVKAGSTVLADLIRN